MWTLIGWRIGARERSGIHCTQSKPIMVRARSRDSPPFTSHIEKWNGIKKSPTTHHCLSSPILCIQYVYLVKKRGATGSLPVFLRLLQTKSLWPTYCTVILYADKSPTDNFLACLCVHIPFLCLRSNLISLCFPHKRNGQWKCNTTDNSGTQLILHHSCQSCVIFALAWGLVSGGVQGGVCKLCGIYFRI